MKKLSALFAVLALAIVVNAQSTNPGSVLVTPNSNVIQTPPDYLVVKESAHDFGKIPQGKPVYYYFEVTNTGTTPLKLENVQASCGCTTPEWSPEPIAPGGSQKIKVGYNSATEGYFDKHITILYNSNQTKQIRITGTVWKAPVGSAPANASVQILKQQNL